MKRRAIYAILDNLTGELVGGQHAISIHAAPASAIRYYSDVANNENTSVNIHTKDYDLVCLGDLNDKNEIVPSYLVIITGEAWLAANRPETPDLTLAK